MESSEPQMILNPLKGRTTDIRLVRLRSYEVEVVLFGTVICALDVSQHSVDFHVT